MNTTYPSPLLCLKPWARSNTQKHRQQRPQQCQCNNNTHVLRPKIHLRPLHASGLRGHQDKTDAICTLGNSFRQYFNYGYPTHVSPQKLTFCTGLESTVGPLNKHDHTRHWLPCILREMLNRITRISVWCGVNLKVCISIIIPDTAIFI